MKNHHYKATITWTGNKGSGTSGYKAYSRDHTIKIGHKEPIIKGTSDPTFMGDPERYNPEDLFLGSLSACHMLWYLHLCSENKIVVTNYVDTAVGVMTEAKNGSGAFTRVTLHPVVTISDSSKVELAESLHKKANYMCFIANSCNFKVAHQVVTKVA